MHVEEKNPVAGNVHAHGIIFIFLFSFFLSLFCWMGLCHYVDREQSNRDKRAQTWEATIPIGISRNIYTNQLFQHGSKIIQLKLYYHNSCNAIMQVTYYIIIQINIYYISFIFYYFISLRPQEREVMLGHLPRDI